MRATVILASLALLASAPVGAQTQTKGEIDYPKGSLGFDALMSGDLHKAEVQLSNGTVDKNDPAVLLNLGQVYALTGRAKDAEAAYRQVLASPDVELLLASGREMSSHRAAIIGLRGVAR